MKYYKLLINGLRSLGERMRVKL